MPEDLRVWLSLHLVAHHAPSHFRTALKTVEDPLELATQLPESLLVAAGVPPGAAAHSVRLRRTLERDLDLELRAAERLAIDLVPHPSPDYPAEIASLPDAPFLLYRRGSLPRGIARVAVVGARRATAYGRRIATQISGELALLGAEIVSGGARGVDTSAHRGAVEAGGRTVAVIGSGLREPYPPDNASLFEKIVESGALLSEFPIDTQPLPENFPRRNRLIAALAAAVVVVEAADRSGSLITARLANEYGKEVLAVPGPIGAPMSVGCLALLKDGAGLAREASDVVGALSPMYRQALADPAPDSPDAPVVDLTPDESAVSGFFQDPEPVHIDVLADRAPFGIARLQAALFGLALRGTVDALPGGYYLPRFPKPSRREDRS